jgi:hypothetical protein
MAEPSYVREAFRMKPNLVFLGVGVVVSLVAGSTLLLGGVAVAEGVYLAGMSTNPRFRRAIRSLRLRS